MKVRYVIGSFLVALLGWLAFKDIVWTVWHSQTGEPVAEAPDHTQGSGWLLRPENPPPAVWERGWAIDIFMLPARPGYGSRGKVIDPSLDAVRTQITERTEALAGPLSGIGPIYVPALRLPSPAIRDPDWSLAKSDLTNAFAAYLETDNRGRAILIAVPPGSEPLLGALSPPLAEASKNLKDRMAGLVQYNTDVPANPPDEICGPAIMQQCLISLPVMKAEAPLAILAPNLPNAWPRHEIISPVTARSALTVRRETVLAWLEKNGAREAEPLGGLETIEVAPIRRPGTQPTPDIRGRDD